MRVIAGTARGRRLEVQTGRDVRPTTDRVKEGLFSILQFSLPDAVVLDLFAGSGQLGIEALSRGAKNCTFVDDSKDAHVLQKRNLSHTGLLPRAKVLKYDAMAFLKNANGPFDIVLLDPPYFTDLLSRSLALLEGKLSLDGKIVCEHDKSMELPEEIAGFRIHKKYKYGKIILTVYTNKEGIA